MGLNGFSSRTAKPSPEKKPNGFSFGPEMDLVGQRNRQLKRENDSREEEQNRRQKIIMDSRKEEQNRYLKSIRERDLQLKRKTEQDRHLKREADSRREQQNRLIRSKVDSCAEKEERERSKRSILNPFWKKPT